MRRASRCWARSQLSDAVTNAVAPSEDGRLLYVSTAMNALVCVERLDAAPARPRRGP